MTPEGGFGGSGFIPVEHPHNGATTASDRHTHDTFMTIPLDGRILRLFFFGPTAPSGGMKAQQCPRASLRYDTYLRAGGSRKNSPDRKKPYPCLETWNSISR